ncbi:hypothetical protein RIF29_13086 [Crotalaria pallida]|uniref:Homeobox domain-containing protein n=1 Tax=Crotalaria pallida TaxID=3830 RepID=A0AAN9P1L9_CROPI
MPELQHEILANNGGLQAVGHGFRDEILAREQMDGHYLQGHGLSISLGTQIMTRIEMPPINDSNHNSCFDSFSGTNPSISVNEAFKSGSSRDESMRHSENFPPGLYRGDVSSHGMCSVGITVPNSKYLKAAQQLLDEVVDIRKAKGSDEEDLRLENDRPSANGVPNSQGSTSNSTLELAHAEKQDLDYKLTKLLSMLDEVDSRYKQYFHQMQIVVSSFDGIAGCGASNSYTTLALQTISCHFRCLRDAITDQINTVQRNLGEQDASGNNKGIGISRLRYVDRQIRQQRALQQLGMAQHACRLQRGLPESSVSILRACYPKDSDKMMLARQTGLTRSQVSNWFINARVQLWKPIIEEIYKQENCEADMDTSSSSENASKVTKSDIKAYNDTGDDSEHYQSSAANKICSGGQAKDLRGIADEVPDREIMESTGIATLQSEDHEGETEHRLVKQMEEQRPNFSDWGLFPNERFWAEFRSFKSGSGMSNIRPAAL